MNREIKWKLYESRHKLREIYFHKILTRHICHRFFNFDPVIHYYANQFIVGKKKTNQWISEKIKSGDPFMVARFGNTELRVITTV